MRRQPTRKTFILVVVALLLAASVRPVGIARAATPTLTLGMSTIACDVSDLAIDVSGSGFSPGATLALGIALINQSGQPLRYTIIGHANANANGAFIAQLSLRGNISCPTRAGGPDATGLPFSIGAFAGDPGAQTADPPLATAHFLVTVLDQRCDFPGPYCISGRFLSYWQKHGGLARFGIPLSGEGRERLEDGNEYIVQYFERARLELHPENSLPYDVLIGQIGRHFHPADPPAPPLADARFFPETGHNLRAGFRDYWEANGGLAAFGFPLSEEFTEQLADGNTYTVQYFERARLEWHPENAAPYRVLLGQLGRRLQSPLIPGPRRGTAAPARTTAIPAQP